MDWIIPLPAAEDDPRNAALFRVYEPRIDSAAENLAKAAEELFKRADELQEEILAIRAIGATVDWLATYARLRPKMIQKILDGEQLRDVVFIS